MSAASLEAWMVWQHQQSIRQMLACVSPCTVHKHRPGFGQTVIPVRGSVVASVALADYDPAPDYFFHWFRDSALVMDAIRQLVPHDLSAGTALSLLSDFVDFGLSLLTLSGQSLVDDPRWRQGVTSDFVQYTRSTEELAAVGPDTIMLESRVNPDGSLDISRWSRPQTDGQALRALTLMRWLRDLPLTADLQARVLTLLAVDLNGVRKTAEQSGVDIWEEEHAWHFYNLRVAEAALSMARQVARVHGESLIDTDDAGRCQRLCQRMRRLKSSAGFVCSRDTAMAVTHPKALDIAVILAAIHVDDRGRLPGDDPAPVLDCGDSCLQNTFHHLVSLFNNRYAINAMRQCDEGVAMGRYADDHYYAGGAYFFSTLGAAEFCFKAAQHARLPTVRDQWFDRGQTFLRTVRRYAANDGTLAEQFRGDNGLADSCPDLAWSHAAFITALAARARAQNLLDTNQKCSAIT